MPKVKNPLFSQEARGGIGGLVFNTWRGINYVKTNTSPTGQGTALRLAAQALLTTVSKLWQTATDANRIAWGQWALDHPVTDWTGSPKRLTGMNWFMKLNGQLARLTSAAVLTPPTIVAPAVVVGLVLSKVGSDLCAAWTTPVTGSLKLDVWLTGPHSAGLVAKIEKAKFKQFTLPTATQPVIIKAAAAVGRWTVFVRTVSTVDGQSSTWASERFDMS